MSFKIQALRTSGEWETFDTAESIEEAEHKSAYLYSQILFCCGFVPKVRKLVEE